MEHDAPGDVWAVKVAMPPRATGEVIEVILTPGPDAGDAAALLPAGPELADAWDVAGDTDAVAGEGLMMGVGVAPLELPQATSVSDETTRSPRIVDDSHRRR